MSKYIFRILIFTFSLISVFISILTFINVSVNDDKYYKIEKDKINLIAGHSHPESSLDTKLIDSTFSIAQSGEQYFYTYLKVKKVLECNVQIKNVFVEFTYNNLDDKNVQKIWSESHIDSFHKEFSSLFGFDEYFLMLHNNLKKELLVEGKSLKHKIGFLQKKKSKFSDNNFGGYKFLKRFKTDSLLLQPIKYKKIKIISDLNINYLRKIVDYCKTKNVTIFFIRCPLHKNYEYRVNEKEFQNLKEKYFKDVEMLDFIDYPISNSDFADFGHLNYKGAKKFSKYFNKCIKHK